MVRVADFIMERLYEEGAKHIFMVTGRGSEIVRLIRHFTQ